MSNLILPKQYENKILEANLKAFFARYPHEQQRLEILLSEPVENRPVVKIDVPACPSTPPLRVLLLAGFGSPLFLADLLNDPTVQSENFLTFIIENNLDFLRFCFQYADLTQIIKYRKVEWFLMQTEESIKPNFFRSLKREEIASMMKNIHILETSVPQPPEVDAFYKKLPELYNETVGHVLHNFGRIDDSLDGVRATLMNRQEMLNSPGIEDLKDVFRGIPALIVGAGPSLDQELENIKKNNDKFVVIAADAALKPLLKAGVRVDYVTSIERLNDYQRPFFEGLPQLETELVAFPVVLPSQFELYPGKKRLVYRNYSYFAYFEKSWPKGILKCGGSTSHLALRLADYMGCSRIFLVGIDSAYENQKGTDLYRSHCSNTGHAEWGEFIPLEDFAKRLHAPPMDAVNNLNETVKTNITYYQWIKEYVEEMTEIGFRIPITNCSSIGLKIEGVPHKSLTEVVKNLDDRMTGKPAQPAVRFNRKFNHKTIVKNFEAWKDLCVKLVDECDQLIAMDEIDLPRYEAVIFIFNLRIAVDPLFVAFVVQCCAKEFFEMENIWWGLDKSWDKDQKNKVKITKAKTNLFKDVLEKTLKIFEETKETGK